MKSKTTGAAAGIVLFVFCFLGGGCAHYNTPAIREDSFLPYVDAKVGGASLSEFLRARCAVVFEGDQLSVSSNSRNVWVKGTISGIGSAAAIDRRGYFLTAAHCIGKGQVLLGSLDKERAIVWPARVVWRGDELKNEPDLALMQVSAPLQDVFEWAPGFTNGERIVAAGIDVLSNSVIKSQCMAGKILKLGAGSASVLPHCTSISHDAPLHSGDSGGPLVSTDGGLIGVNSYAVIGRPRWVSFTVETLSSDAERPDLEWLKQLIEQDAATQSKVKTNEPAFGGG